MTEKEVIYSFVKRIKRLNAIFSNGMCGAKCDYGMIDNDIADTYEDCIDSLYDMFPDVLSSDGVFYNIELNIDIDDLKPIKREDIDETN